MNAFENIGPTLKVLYEIFCKLFSVFAVLNFDLTVINTMYNIRQKKEGGGETLGRVKLSPCQYLKLCVALNVGCNGSDNAVSPEEQYGGNKVGSKGTGSQLHRKSTLSFK